jgi:hypothetical protein
MHTLINRSKLKDGPGSATLQKPPNHQLFNAVSPMFLAEKSPLMQARLKNIARDNPLVQPQPIAPVINVHMPNDLFQPHQYPALVPGPPVPAMSNALIPAMAHLTPDNNMSIDDFCSTYKLSDSILQCLRENRFTQSHAFRHIQVDDLKAMGLVLGEIADVREAVLKWVSGNT